MAAQRVANNLARLADLERDFREAGGENQDFRLLANGGLEVGDDMAMDATADGALCRAVSLRTMRSGSLVEYHCYDNRGRPQGVAIVRFEGWLNEGKLEFRGTHLPASDKYYEWYGQHELAAGSTVYHFCENARRSCRSRGGAGSEYVHIGKWRRVSPRLLVGVGYASDLGLKELTKVLERHLSNMTPPAPVGPATSAPAAGGASLPPGREREVSQHRTTGLDAAMKAAPLDVGDDDDEEEARQLLEDATRAKRGRAPGGEKARPASGRKDFGSVLLEKARDHGDKDKDRSRSGSKRKPSKAETSEGLRKRKAKRMDEVSSSEGESSESGPTPRLER